MSGANATTAAPTRPTTNPTTATTAPLPAPAVACATANSSLATISSPPPGLVLRAPVAIDVVLEPVCFDTHSRTLGAVFQVARTNPDVVALAVTPFSSVVYAWPPEMLAAQNVASRYVVCAQLPEVGLSPAHRLDFLQCFLTNAGLSATSARGLVTAVASSCITSSIPLPGKRQALAGCATDAASNATATVAIKEAQAETFAAFGFDPSTLGSTVAFVQGAPLCKPITSLSTAALPLDVVATATCRALLSPPPSSSPSPSSNSTSPPKGSWPFPLAPTINTDDACGLVSAWTCGGQGVPPYRGQGSLGDFVPIVSLFLLSASLISLMCMLLVKRRARQSNSRRRSAQALARNAVSEQRLNEIMELLSRMSAQELLLAQDAERRTALSVANVDATLARFPKRTMPTEGAGAGETCSVCLDPLAGTTVYDLPACGHLFHPNCLRDWLVRNGTCPVCRTQIVVATGVSPFSSAGVRAERAAVPPPLTPTTAGGPAASVAPAGSHGPTRAEIDLELSRV